MGTPASWASTGRSARAACRLGGSRRSRYQLSCSGSARTAKVSWAGGRSTTTRSQASGSPSSAAGCSAGCSAAEAGADADPGAAAGRSRTARSARRTASRPAPGRTASSSGWRGAAPSRSSTGPPRSWRARRCSRRCSSPSTRAAQRPGAAGTGAVQGRPPGRAAPVRAPGRGWPRRAAGACGRAPCPGGRAGRWSAAGRAARAGPTRGRRPRRRWCVPPLRGRSPGPCGRGCSPPQACAPLSTRFFRPARARSMMTFSALRLIIPSMGILTSTVSWYVTSVRAPSAGVSR